MLALFMIVWGSIWIGIKEVLINKDTTIAIILIGILGVLAHLLIDYNLQFVGIALPFWFLLGAIHKPIRKIKVVKHSFIIVCVLLAVSIIEGIGLVQSSKGRAAEKNGDYNSALYWYNKASWQYTIH